MSAWFYSILCLLMFAPPAVANPTGAPPKRTVGNIDGKPVQTDGVRYTSEAFRDLKQAVYYEDGNNNLTLQYFYLNSLKTRASAMNARSDESGMREFFKEVGFPVADNETAVNAKKRFLDQTIIMMSEYWAAMKENQNSAAELINRTSLERDGKPLPEAVQVSVARGESRNRKNAPPYVPTFVDLKTFYERQTAQLDNAATVTAEQLYEPFRDATLANASQPGQAGRSVDKKVKEAEFQGKEKEEYGLASFYSGGKEAAPVDTESQGRKSRARQRLAQDGQERKVAEALRDYKRDLERDPQYRRNPRGFRVKEDSYQAGAFLEARGQFVGQYKNQSAQLNLPNQAPGNPGAPAAPGPLASPNPSGSNAANPGAQVGATNPNAPVTINGRPTTLSNTNRLSVYNSRYVRIGLNEQIEFDNKDKKDIILQVRETTNNLIGERTEEERLDVNNL